MTKAVHPLLFTCPYPHCTDEGVLIDGLYLSQDNFCLRKCEHHECRYYPAVSGTPVLYTCPHGYSVATALASGLPVRVNGVIEHASNVSSASFKKERRDRKLKLPVLNQWLRTASDVHEIIQSMIDGLAKDSIHALHDIKSHIGNILSASEQFLAAQGGTSIDEKVDAADPNFRRIYHSCRILETLLQMTDILANPQSAAYGQPRPTLIHSVMFMLKKVHEDKAKKSDLTIELYGTSNNQSRLYNSFIVLPLVLLDNAIKHATKGSAIHIRVEDRPNGGVHFEVSSHGSLVPVHQHEAIFDRGVRGDNANAPGSGLGLFIAKRVADANGITLRYTTRPTGHNAPLGFNIFSCDVPPTTAPRTRK